jgi:hypothetical protein
MASFNSNQAATYAVARINNLGGEVGNDNNHTTRGSWTVTRLGSAVAIYYNGSSAGYPNGGYTGTVAAVVLPDTPFAIGALNQGSGSIVGYSTNQISSFYVAGDWTSAQALAFYNAETTLLTAIGVLP